MPHFTATQRIGWNSLIKTMAVLKGKNRAENERRNDLENNLKLGHYAWFSVREQYDGTNSYIIYNISLDNALYLGGRFGQESIIFIEGFHYEYWKLSEKRKFTKTHEREMRQELDMTNVERYFTQISRAVEFRIPFFDGSDENRKIMCESAEYVCATIQKHTKTLHEAQRRIQNCIEAKSAYNRFCNRGELYRNAFL